ncbi:MAG TPA: glycosyltransferase family 39 protein [Candidatus Polarisedimenticolia bacterium]|nr:glycosyltransferase family 39 protein [Candidatus Polarisedimenticolia bacterium]
MAGRRMKGETAPSRIVRFLALAGVPLSVGLALGGQFLISLKSVTPLRGLLPGLALYAAALGLLLLALTRRGEGGPASGPTSGKDAPEAARGHLAVLPRGLEWGLVAALVLFGGLFLRLQHIDLIPWGLNNDEAINAIEVQDILAGKPFATFTVRGLNRETMFHYLAALAYRNPGLALNVLRAMPAVFNLQPERINGPSNLADPIFPLRSVSIAAGTLTILLLYLFARRRFGWRVAFLAGLFLAFSPWHLLYSRVGLRTILAPPFAIVAVWLLLRALDSGRTRDHLAWGAALGLGLWTYTSFRALPLAFAVYLLGRALLEPAIRASLRRARGAMAAAAGVVTAALLLLWAFSRLGLIDFILRGAYASLTPKASFPLNLLHTLTMGNYFPARYAVVQSDAFFSDGVSAVYGLIGREPETMVAAALATLGLVYAAWRARRRRDAASALILTCFLVTCLTVGIAGPSLTRMLLNLPWLCLFAALMAGRLFDDLEALRRPFGVFVAAAAVLGLAALACAQGYGQYFQFGRPTPLAARAMQNFGAPQTIMGVYVRSLPPGEEIYVMHTLRVDTLHYLIGNRPEVHLVSDPSTLDYEAIVRLPRTVTFVVEYARPFAEPLRMLMVRFPQGDMSQVADARLDPEKPIFYTFTLWKDESGQPIAPPAPPPS